MNTILIIYDNSIESDILRNRIKSMGDSFVFWDNHWLLRTEMSVKETYDKIVTDGYEKKSIFLVKIDTQIGDYWGFMNKALWDWIKKNDNTFSSFGK